MSSNREPDPMNQDSPPSAAGCKLPVLVFGESAAYRLDRQACHSIDPRLPHLEVAGGAEGTAYACFEIVDADHHELEVRWGGLTFSTHVESLYADAIGQLLHHTAGIRRGGHPFGLGIAGYDPQAGLESRHILDHVFVPPGAPGHVAVPWNDAFESPRGIRALYQLLGLRPEGRIWQREFGGYTLGFEAGNGQEPTGPVVLRHRGEWIGQAPFVAGKRQIHRAFTGFLRNLGEHSPDEHFTRIFHRHFAAA